MRLLGLLLCRSNANASICVLLCVQLLHAQAPDPTSQRQSDVLRVFTELVQTDVMVFNKNGDFVHGLKKEDFELRIDGKTKPIDFFETIKAGSANEESQLAAARGVRSNAKIQSSPVPLDRGRPVYFYVDDLHLDLQGVRTTQKLIRNFIDQEMGQNDELAVAAASGQIGFLSQLTDNKAVLRAAVDRLQYRSYSGRDPETPRMTEYQALLISNYDNDVTNFFVDYLISDNPGLSRSVAEQMVRNRAEGISRQASNVTTNTLVGLERLVRSINKVPGRKLIFFISDGFYLHERNSTNRERLRRITSAAAGSGVVIYSIDSRGLDSGGADTSSQIVSRGGRVLGASSDELVAAQHGLNALASDTGGKAIFNSNAMEPAVKRAVEETTTYYLLAWKPEQPSSGSSKFHRIEVRVAGRSDLTVQVRRGFFGLDPETGASEEKKDQQIAKGNKSALEFQQLINAAYPEREIPLALRTSFVNTVKGDTLLATLQLPMQFLSFKALEGKPTARVAVVGGIYDANGKVADRFGQQVTITSTKSAGSDQDLLYDYPSYLKPGLYQVRVAARDDHSGRGGSAFTWIEIPNVSSGQLSLSSVFLGVRAQPAISNGSPAPVGFSTADLKVSNRFAPNDFLRFLVFVYNATSTHDSKPDLAIQIHVVRDDQPVITTPLKKILLEEIEDLKRIPYAAEVSLEGLRPGRYILQISVVDRLAKTSTSQHTRFEVE